MAETTKRRHPLQPANWSMGEQRIRFDAMRPFLEHRTVLDLGFGQGFWREDWVHRLIVEIATEVVGVDLNPEAVAASNAEGWEAHVGDATTVDLGRRFDVVFAGALIEHLGNAEALLQTARRHLHPEGRFMLSAPNAFALSNFVYRIGGHVRVNTEHVAWYCEDTLTALLERHGWTVETLVYEHHETPGRLRRVLAEAIRWPLPERLRWASFLVVARP